MQTRSPKSPVAPFSPLHKINEEPEESYAGRRNDTPIPERGILEEEGSPLAQKSSIRQQAIFDYEHQHSPVRNAGGKQSPEKLSAKEKIQEDEFMFYSKQDVDALLNQITGLQHKLESLAQQQKLTLEQLDTEQFRSAELAITLKQQQKHFQEKEYSVNKSNMLLLDKKSKEQERWIQSIKMDM